MSGYLIRNLKDMLIQESRVLVIVALAVTLLVAGCRQKSQKVNRVQVDSLETQDIRQHCVEKTISIIGIKSYHEILL
jgi:type IV pilus biogenesis protein CpaD/CtpE